MPGYTRSWTSDKVLEFSLPYEFSPEPVVVQPAIDTQMIVNGDPNNNPFDAMPADHILIIERVLKSKRTSIERIITDGPSVRIEFKHSMGQTGRTTTARSIGYLLGDRKGLRGIDLEPPPRVVALHSSAPRTSSEMALARKIESAKARANSPRSNVSLMR